MTAIERSKSLRARVNELQTLERLQGQAESIQTRVDELRSRRERLGIAFARGQTLIAKALLASESFPPVETAVASLSRVIKRAEDDPAAVSKGKDYSNLLEALDRVADTLEELVDEAWSRFVERCDPVEEQLLHRLVQVPGQAPQVRRVRDLRDAFQQVVQEAPASAEQYDAALEAADTLRRAWESLDHGDLPDSVLAFLNAARSRNGAPADLWTDEVRLWLEGHNLLRSIRIFLGGAK